MNRSVDLLPESYAAGRDLRRVLSFWLVAGAGVEILVLVFAFLLRWHAMQLNLSLESLRDNTAGFSEMSKQATPLVDQLRLALNREQVVERLISQPDWITLLHELSTACGQTAWFEQVEILGASTKQTSGENKEGYVIGISGTAKSNDAVIDFMRKLNNSPLIKNLMLQESQTPVAGETTQLLKFKIRADIGEKAGS